MSKIGNLFKKIFKKNKSSQDLDEVFFEEEELSEETVILPELDDDIEAPPHPIKADTKTPKSTELEFPESDDEELTNTKVVPEKHSHPAHEPLQEMQIERTGESEIINRDELNEPVTPDLQTTEGSLNEEFTDFQQTDDQGFEEDEFHDEPEDGFEEEFNDEFNDDFTSEIDLDEGSISFRDRLDHLGTRVKDRFRNLNTKDLNQVYKNKKMDITSSINLDDLKRKAAKVDWSSIPEKFFNELNHPRYHRWFQASFIVFLLIAVSTILGKIIGGDKNYRELGRNVTVSLDRSQLMTRNDLNKIKDADLFKTDQKIIEDAPDKQVNTQKICKTASRRSQLNVQLVNTIVLQDSVKSIASVQISSKKDLLIGREGDTINNNIKIGKIESERLIFKNLSNSECEFIEQKMKRRAGRSSKISVMSPSRAKNFKEEKKKIDGIKQEGNEFKIKRDFLKSKIDTDMTAILSQARGIMRKNPDGSMSFKIVDVEPGGIFAYLGINDNDVISQINGEPIKELNDVMNLFGKVTSLSNLSITVERNGEQVTQNYTIE